LTSKKQKYVDDVADIAASPTLLGFRLREGATSVIPKSAHLYINQPSIKANQHDSSQGGT